MKELSIRKLDDSNSDKWNDFVLRTKNFSFYHRVEWIKVLEKSFYFKSLNYLIFEKENVIAIFPNMISSVGPLKLNFLSSLPKGYGGPLIAKHQKLCLDLFFDKIDREFLQNRLFHHRILSDNLSHVIYSKYYSKRGYTPNLNGCHFILDIKDETYESLVSSFTKKRRWAIRKALSNKDFKIEQLEITLDNIKSFYIHHKKAYYERHKKEPYPLKFFIEVFSRLKDKLLIFEAKFRNDVIGSFMHILSKENNTVYHYFNTVYPDFYKHNVVELLHDATIKWCISNGYRYYDLGGTGSGFDEGNLQFKKQFSEVIPNLAWDRGGFNLLNYAFNKYKLLTSKLKR